MGGEGKLVIRKTLTREVELIIGGRDAIRCYLDGCLECSEASNHFWGGGGGEEIRQESTTVYVRVNFVWCLIKKITRLKRHLFSGMFLHMLTK